MNILVVAESFYPRVRGGEVVLWRVSNALTRRGHNIKVITSQLDKTPKYEKINGIEIFRPYPTGHMGRTTSLGELYRKIVYNKKIYSFLNKFLIDHPIDIIYNQAYPLTIITTLLGDKYKIPVVVSVDCFQEKAILHTKTFFADLFHILKRLIILRFSKYEVIHCGSTFISNKLSKYTNKNIFTIANPIESDLIEQLKKNTDTNEIRNELGLLPEEQFLLFVGALVPVKNVKGLIMALARLEREFKLVLVGNGPEKDNIEELVKTLDLEKMVLLLGERNNEETLKIMKSCDVLILPSKSEVAPVVVIEALSLGKPVIATKVGGTVDIVSKNLYLINNLYEINRILEKGISPKHDNKTIREFSIHKIVESYEKMFIEVLENYET